MVVERREAQRARSRRFAQADLLWRAPRPKRGRVATSVRVAWPTTPAPPGAPLENARGFSCEWLFVNWLWQNSDAQAPRERDYFPPPRSGGGGPLELAKRANRGGGGAGLVASLPLQKDDDIEVASLTCGKKSSKLKVGVFSRLLRNVEASAPSTTLLRRVVPLPRYRGGGRGVPSSVTSSPAPALRLAPIGRWSSNWGRSCWRIAGRRNGRRRRRLRAPADAAGFSR